MNNNSTLTNNPATTRLKKKRFNSPFISEFVFIGFCFFFVAIIVMSYEIWNSDNRQINLFEANFETFNWERSVYSWQLGEKPVTLQKMNDPDRNDWQVLSIKKGADPHWSGIGKVIILHTTPSFVNIVKIRIKNNSEKPLPMSFEIQEASSASHPVSEVWNTEFTLASDQWETLNIPLSTLALKNYYQPEGKTGNKKFDLWPLSQLSIVFPPNMDIDIWLDTIHLTVESYPRLLIAILILDFIWCGFLLKQVLRNRACEEEKSIYLFIEIVKFIMYHGALIATPNRSGVAIALCILLIFSLFESYYAFFSPKDMTRFKKTMHVCSPLIAASVLFVYASSWQMVSLIVAAHCLYVLYNRQNHGLEWGVSLFIVIFLFNTYVLNASIYPILTGIGLISLFCMHYFLSSFEQFLIRERAQIEFQNLYEQQILHNQKMEAVSQITRGIAHEFNNLLTGIMGNLKMMQIKKNQDNSEFITNALESSTRAADLIKKLQMYGRLSHVQPKEIHFNTLLEESIKILKQSLRPDITLKTNAFECDEILHLDPLRIKIVFMNLLMNARDAIDEAKNKGFNRDFYIEIISSYVDITRQTQNDYTKLPGRYVVVTIADNGIGMNQETLKKAFDPFYSNKEININTGLGLSCAHGIVKEHKGWIDVKSELGEGTQFRIFLPCNSHN